MSVKRFDGTNWVDISKRKKYDGTSWVDVQSEKKYINSNWVEIYNRGTDFHFELHGVTPSSVAVTKHSDDSVTVSCKVTKEIPEIFLMVDSRVKARNPSSITATCIDLGNMPSVSLGFKSSPTSNVSTDYYLSLSSTPKTVSSTTLTPVNDSYPFIQFLSGGLLSIGSTISFRVKINEIIVAGTKLPSPFNHNSIYDIFSVNLESSSGDM